MSGIQGVSGSGASEVYAMLLQASRQTTASSTSSTAGAQSTGTNAGGIEDLKSQMDAAISDALSKLDKSSSADVVLATIKQAMDDTLKANGIDPAAMKDFPPPPPPPPPAEGDEDSTQTDAARGDDLATTLRNILKENGFDPDKIREELLAEQNSSDSSSSSNFDMLYRVLTTSGINTQA
jgi:hypothetical protein